MTRSHGFRFLLLLTTGVPACGNEISPVIDGRPDSPVVLDSVTGDSVLAYHPTLPDSLSGGGPKIDSTGTGDTTIVKPGSPTPADTLSPTGRAPRLIWTPQRQGVWNRMRTERHPLFILVEDNCRAARQGSPRYSDNAGQWCTLHYQMTGDIVSARQAWTQLESTIRSVPNANDVREYFTESVILYDWLYPALSPAERQQAVVWLERWAEYTLGIGTSQYVGGTRTSDSDALVGYYFGLIALDLVGENTVPATRRWRSAVGAATWIPQTPVGGLDASGGNHSTLRNAIYQYATARATGGEWIESEDYNLGTLKLMMLGVEAVRTATNADHYPELTQFLIDAARMQSAHVTTDMKQALQWGDEEHPRDFTGRLFKRITMLGMLAGVAQGTAQGAEAQALVGDLFTRYGTRGYLSAEPWSRLFFLYNPYAATSDWRRPGVTFASGRGLLQVRDAASLFSAMVALPTGEDHEVFAFGNFQLYRNGEWVITNPLGYANEAVQGESHNTLLIAGMSSMPSRTLVDQSAGPGWASVSARTGGPYYGGGYYDPPPAFLREWMRAVVYLSRGGVDWVITVDDVDATHPESMPKFGRYRPADQARIRGTPLIQWIIHTPEQAVADGADRIRWRTRGGQPVIVHRLDSSTSWQAINEGQLWSGSPTFIASEKKFQVRIEGPASGGRVIHAVSVGADAPPPIQAIPDGVQIGVTQVRVVGGVVTVTN